MSTSIKNTLFTQLMLQRVVESGDIKLDVAQIRQTASLCLILHPLVEHPGCLVSELEWI